MLFPSQVFMWVFLPVVLIVYYGLLRKTRVTKNIWLLIASLYFYAWGEPEYVFLMIAVIAINYLLGLFLYVTEDKPLLRKVLLIIGIVADLSVLAWYKYSGFGILQFNRFLHTDIAVPDIALPIGISFFTFQAMSYIIDVYRGKTEVQMNPLYVGLYIAFFPQLIAGPIVRYSTIADQIEHRDESFQLVSAGVVRFIRGLIKKVIIANNIAMVADAAFQLTGADAYAGNASMAWLGAISYTLQIFFDFSAYSDMAIGLGQMFGFHFEENFNYPYIASSITDFWRRWHISLSGWFRDYVYIPLGGSRVSVGRLVLNLFIVWLLTGIWHGANWTFIAWGMLYFIFLTIEKLTGLHKQNKWWGHIYTLLVVIVAWVIFRADNMGEAITYLKAMCGIGTAGGSLGVTLAYIRENAIYYILAIAGSLPLLPRLEERYGDSKAWNIIYGILLVAGLVISMSFIVNNAYSPFIYFNF